MEQMVGLKEGVCEVNTCKIVTNSSTGQSSVDFPNNSKKEAVKCEHFSIRGYVADIRRRDWELCWPFSPPGENEELEGLGADVLPPLYIPKFRFWDCQRCIQTSDASDNAADVSSIVLETICVGKKDAAMNVNGSENCPTRRSYKKGNGAITVSDIGQDVLTSNNNNTVTRGVDKILIRQKIGKVKDTKRHKVNLNIEACALFGFEGTNCGIAANGADKETKTWQNLKNADVNSRRRKFRPYESSDDEDIHSQSGKRGSDQLADPSQITSFKRSQKFRLLSDILREENSGSVKVSDSRWAVDQTKAPYQPDSLVLCDQTDVENGIEEKNKKGKALEDEDHDHLHVRCSKSLAKNVFYQRDQMENDIECSNSSYGKGQSYLPENGKHLKVSQKRINDKGTIFEDRANHNFMGKKGEVVHVEMPAAHWGLKNKKAFNKKQCMRAKQNNTNQVHVAASTLRPKDLPLLCNSDKNKNLNQTEANRIKSNDKADKVGESEDSDDVSLKIVELLAKSRHECHCQEAQNADQIKSSVLEKTVNVKTSENVLQVRGKNSKKICKTCKNNSFVENQKGSLAPLSFHSYHFGGTQFVEPIVDKLGDRFCRWDGDKFVSKKPISYSQSSTSYPNHQMISHLTDMQGANHVSWQTEDGNDLEVHKKILSEKPCACTQKKIGNFAKPVASSGVYTNRYMPATELLELMDAGMCPTIPHPEKSKQIPILKTDFSKDHSKLGICHYPSSPKTYSVVIPVQRHEDSALSSRINQSEIVVAETVKFAKRKRKNSFSSLEVDCVLKKPSCGNEDLGIKDDPFFSNVMPLKAETLSLEHCLTYDSVATLQRMYGNLGIEICSMNRNPADFAIPGPGNRFMLGSRELKMWRKFTSLKLKKRKMELPDLNDHVRN